MRKFKKGEVAFLIRPFESPSSFVDIIKIVEVEPDAYVGSLPYKIDSISGNQLFPEWCSERELKKIDINIPVNVSGIDESEDVVIKMSDVAKLINILLNKD